MASAQPLEFRWGIISTGSIAADFVKVFDFQGLLEAENDSDVLCL